MNRTFFYIPLFLLGSFHLIFGQKINYDSVLLTLPDAQAKYTYLVRELEKSDALGAVLALELAKKRLNYAMQLNDTAKVAAGYNSVGNQYLDLSDYSAALNYYIKSSKYYEMIHDSLGLSAELGNIGLVYSFREDDNTAKKFILNAMNILKKHKGIERYYSTLANLGDTYRSLNMIDSAFYCWNEVISGTKDNSLISIIHNNIGLYFLNEDKVDSAIWHFQTSNGIDKKLGSKLSYVISLSNLGDCYFRKGDVKKALVNFRTALSLAEEIKNLDQRMLNCQSLADVFKSRKEYDSAFFYLEKYNAMADSLKDTNAETQMADLRSGFDREEKEKELLLHQLESQKQDQEQRNKINYLVVAAIFLVGIIVFAVYRYRSKQRSYDKLKLLNNEIVVQKTLVEVKQKEIVDSITYARRIQRPLLAKDDILATQFDDFFAVFRPKDIVSGDFYWSTFSLDKDPPDFYLAVCDSTGHGVPGAFMSLLNIGFLSEAIKEKHIDEPEEIFNYVRSRLIESISDDGQKDGFDGIMIRYNKSQKKMYYCGAHNTPVLIRDGQIKELHCDKMPVGKGERNQTFMGHELELKKGDVIYLYTDGYADQFGGPKGKKFKYKKLNELLLSIHTTSMKEQQHIIEKTFDEWKKDLEQVDDVTVIGLRI